MTEYHLHEVLSFCAVLVRFSVIFTVIPFIGDRLVPTPIKILVSLTLSLALFSSLKNQGFIHIEEARNWDGTIFGIVGTMTLEAMLGLMLGFVTHLVFDTITIGANLIGNFMGFSMANSYDPHQESQTEVIAHIQTTLAMLLFLAVDGHHLMIRALLQSYQRVGVGQVGFQALLSQKIIGITAFVFETGVRLAAPMALGLFAVNLVFGIISKAMPQLNVLVLAFAVNALVGFLILFLSLWESHDAYIGIFGHMREWLYSTLQLAGKGG